MAVNKNFVVKNGLEVNDNLIIADATNNRVGIGSTIPDFTLDVLGGIGATDIRISGLSTFVGFSTFQDSIGVQKDITIAGISTVVGVATFRNNVFIDGDLNVAGDIDFDEIRGRNLNITGLSTFVGFSTFKDNVFVAGVGTFASDLSVLGNLNVTGDLSYDEVTGRNINITGLSTFVGFSTFKDNVFIAGVATATSFHGDGSNLTGLATALTASVGLSSEGDFVGTGATIIDFKTTTGTNIQTVTIASGIGTVTIQPGVSLGLAIALGG
tara:strand:- start:475 stop:1281 length:807 start_codon:yes stop_codon:yes gene_type:complete